MEVIKIQIFMSSRLPAINPAAKRMESPGKKNAIRIPVSIKIIKPKAR